MPPSEIEEMIPLAQIPDVVISPALSPVEVSKQTVPPETLPVPSLAPTLPLPSFPALEGLLEAEWRLVQCIMLLRQTRREDYRTVSDRVVSLSQLLRDFIPNHFRSAEYAVPSEQIISLVLSFVATDFLDFRDDANVTRRHQVCLEALRSIRKRGWTRLNAFVYLDRFIRTLSRYSHKEEFLFVVLPALATPLISRDLFANILPSGPDICSLISITARSFLMEITFTCMTTSSPFSLQMIAVQFWALNFSAEDAAFLSKSKIFARLYRLMKEAGSDRREPGSLAVEQVSLPFILLGRCFLDRKFLDIQNRLSDVGFKCTGELPTAATTTRSVG